MKNDEKTNVMRLLESRKIPYTAHTYEPDPSLSGEDIARILGEDPAVVFKTLVTRGKTGAYYVFVIPVSSELDLKKAARAAGEKYRICTRRMFPGQHEKAVPHFPAQDR